MHRHEMQQSNIYLGIYIIVFYFCWKIRVLHAPSSTSPPRRRAPPPSVLGSRAGLNISVHLRRLGPGRLGLPAVLDASSRDNRRGEAVS
jgi:hypothetical protein